MLFLNEVIWVITKQSHNYSWSLFVHAQSELSNTGSVYTKGSYPFNIWFYYIRSG